MRTQIDGMYGDSMRVIAHSYYFELEITDGYDGKRSKIVLAPTGIKKLKEALARCMS